MVVVTAHADHALAGACHLIVNVRSIVQIGALVRAAVGDLKGTQIFKAAVGRIGVERPSGVVVGNEEAVLTCGLDDLVHTFYGEDALVVGLAHPFKLIQIIAGIAPNALGIVADHLDVVRILGVEVQMYLLVVVKGVHLALVEDEGGIVGVAEGIFIGSDGNKFVVCQMR